MRHQRPYHVDGGFEQARNILGQPCVAESGVRGEGGGRYAPLLEPTLKFVGEQQFASLDCP